MKVSDISDAKFNGYSAVEMKYGGEVVWPLEYSYVLQNPHLVFSEPDFGGIRASGGSGSYAQIIANILVYRSGTYIRTDANVPLTAVKVSGEGFYSEGSKIMAENRGTEEGAIRSAVFYGIYSNQQTGNYIIQQEANEREELAPTYESVSYYLTFDLPTGGLTAGGGEVGVRGLWYYNLIANYEYTSGATEQGDPEPGSDYRSPQSVTFSSDVGVRYNNDIIYVGLNGRNLDARLWDVTATFAGKSSTQTLIQGGDSKTESVQKDTFFATIGVATGQITAAGGSVLLYVGGSHWEQTYIDWMYGEDEIIGRHQVSDNDLEPYEAYDPYEQFSIDGLTVSHKSMGTNARTEQARYEVKNGDVTESVTLSATNSILYSEFNSAEVDLVPVEYTIGCLDEYASLTSLITRNMSYVYASGARQAYTDHNGTMTLSYGSDTFSVSHNSIERVYVGDNKHSLSSYALVFSLKYEHEEEAFSDTATIYQESDTTYSRTITYDPTFVVTLIQDRITAAGGYADYAITSYHMEQEVIYWYSDDVIKDRETPVSVDDGYDVSHTESSYFSGEKRTGGIYHITHDNMAKRETTDSISYTFSSRTFTESVTLSATNAKSSHVSAKEYGTPTTTSDKEYRNYYVDISASAYTSSTSPCPASGGTSTISASASHEERLVTTTKTPWTDYTITEWTSGASETSVHDTGIETSVDYGTWGSKSDTPTITYDPIFSRSGSTITIGSEGSTEYLSGRSGRVYANILDLSTGTTKSDYVTLYQEANVLTITSYTYRKSFAVSISGNIPAEGGTYYFNAESYRTGHGTWTSGDPYTGTEEAYASTLSCDTSVTLSHTSISGSIRGTVAFPENESTALTVTYTFDLYNAGGHSYEYYTQEKSAAPYFYIEPSSLTFPASGGSRTVTVYSSYPSFSISGRYFWVTYSKSGNTVTFTAQSFSLPDPRPATFTFTADGGPSVTLDITQFGTV